MRQPQAHEAEHRAGTGPGRLPGRGRLLHTGSRPLLAFMEGLPSGLISGLHVGTRRGGAFLGVAETPVGPQAPGGMGGGTLAGP